MRARESAVSEESSLRPRLRGSLAVMLERYCAKQRRCRGAPSVATAIRKYDGISEFVARPRPDVPVVQTERAARIDNRRVSIEVSGQWLFENARHSSDTYV